MLKLNLTIFFAGGMKKFFSLLIIFSMLFSPCAYGASVSSTKKAKVSKTYPETMTGRINKIGKRLLEKNKIEANVRFKLKKTSKVNAYANLYKDIVVYSALVRLCDNDEELAGIIAHELGHIVNSHVVKINVVNSIANVSLNVAREVPIVALPAALLYKLSFRKWSRSEEYEADATAVDLLVGAGYNPLAMVSVLEKINDEAYLDFFSTHPSGEKRTVYVYDYIAHTYPKYIEEGYDTESFAIFMSYYEDILEERKESPEKLISHQKKFSKLEEKRKKKYEKYQKAYYKKQEKLKEKELKQEQKALKSIEKAKQKRLKEEQKALEEKLKQEQKD